MSPSVPRLVPRPAGPGVDLLCTYLFEWPIQSATMRELVGDGVDAPEGWEGSDPGPG